MLIKMIVCDLDGTLLRTDKTMSKYTLDTLNKCRNLGVKFAIATARNIYETAPIVEALKPDAVVYQGGALAEIDGKIIHSVVLSADSAIAIIEGLLLRDDVAKITSIGEDYHETGFAGRYPDGLHSVSAQLSKPLGDFVKNLPDVDIIQFAGENWVRFGRKDATKWHAVQACAVHMGIDAAEIAAFGDDAIDIGMIMNCGIGVAMANAINEAKVAADFVCDTNDNDGVAKWLAEHVLKGD